MKKFFIVLSLLIASGLIGYFVYLRFDLESKICRYYFWQEVKILRDLSLRNNIDNCRDCLMNNGIWKFSLSHNRVCVGKYKDGAQPCNDSSECQGDCLLDCEHNDCSELETDRFFKVPLELPEIKTSQYGKCQSNSDETGFVLTEGFKIYCNGLSCDYP